MRKTIKECNLLILFLTVLFVIAGINLVGLCILHSSGVVNRLLPICEIKDESSHRFVPDTGEDQSRFYNFLSDKGFFKDRISINGIIRFQQFVGNSIKNVGVYYGNENGFDLFKKGTSGTPLACDSMAIIFKEGLEALGYKARLIQLYKSDFSSSDTHMLVEVFINGKWRLFDPTFNVTFEHEGNLLGVNEVQELLHTKGPNEVNIIYYGDRAYPARIDNYYMAWRPFFNNAYVVGAGVKNAWWSRVPPLRWWHGPKLYYFGEDLLLWAKATNQILFLNIVVFPFILLFVFIVFVGLLIKKRINSR